jgi:hypothetical protein
MQTAKINIKDKTFSAVVVDTEESRQKKELIPANR